MRGCVGKVVDATEPSRAGEAAHAAPAQFSANTTGIDTVPAAGRPPAIAGR